MSIFVDRNNPITPEFYSLYSDPEDVILKLHSGTSSCQFPELTIFFDNPQEATNFKNAIIQSWEAFIKKTEKEKS